MSILQQAREHPHHFESLYQHYIERVFGYCLRRIGNNEDAEDVCSEAFLRILKSIKTYRGGFESAWIFRIVNNSIADYYRKKKTSIPFDESYPADTNHEYQKVESKIDYQNLTKKLKSSQKEILDLYLFAKLSSSEIADVLSKNPSTVRVELHRIFKFLREEYVHE